MLSLNKIRRCQSIWNIYFERTPQRAKARPHCGHGAVTKIFLKLADNESDFLIPSIKTRNFVSSLTREIGFHPLKTPMKTILSLAAVVALAGSASSQVLSEDFSTGVPPTGWTLVDNNGAASLTWEADGTGRAWHQDDFSGVTSDNTLISPAMDLSGTSGTTLTFDGSTQWSAWLANHPTSFGDGISNMEVSTDGGATWTVVWTDTSTADGSYSASADLSAFDGMTGVQLGIHFYGTYAQEWWVDNVVIDAGGAGGPVYSATGLVGGGTATLTVTGATASGGVLLGYSLTGAGPTNTPFGAVDMSAPISTLPTLTADAAGTASMTTGVPARASGFTVYTQGADLTSGMLTNSLAEVIL